MKTREQIYGQEAASILRDVAMYKALTEEQLLRLYPQKESKVKNLLAYLVRQGRLHRSGGYFCVDSEQVEHIDRGMMSAVWVLLDFIEQAEFHSVGEYPAKIIFLAGGEVYEIIYVEEGKDTLVNQLLSKAAEAASKYIVLVDQPDQIPELHIPNTSGYCTVSREGAVQYYQIE